MTRQIADDRFLSEDECDTLVAQLTGFAQGGGATLPRITSWWQGELRWARNRITLASDRRDVGITVTRVLTGGRGGTVVTNQRDPTSLAAAVRVAERQAVEGGGFSPGLAFEPPLPKLERPKTTVWSDTTYQLTTEARGEVVRALVAPAAAQSMLSAGYLEVRAGSQLRFVNGEREYVRFTQAQCSVTVRDAQGTGSGWAGSSSYDWAKIDGPALAKQALKKCLASRNPVALEPGRYTVVLEPQAVADLLEVLVQSFWRPPGPGGAENGDGPFALEFSQPLQLWRTKLGLKVVDERLTLSHDPADPALGILPNLGMQPLTWIDHGVLTALDYWRGYAVEWLGENRATRSPEGSYRLSGGETSVDEMIATTKRGLLVTRFGNVRQLDPTSLLSTGLTRDGLWLIENGKITKPVKNFRFTESPLFLLNQLEQLGVPVSVFRPVRNPDQPGLAPAIVPPLKARDFSFTSSIDAI